MKKTIGIALVFLVFTYLIGIVNAADRYKWIYSDDKYGYFFDTTTIKYDRNYDNAINTSVVDVWIKMVFTEQGKIEYIKNQNLTYEQYKNLDSLMMHYKFDIDKFRVNLLTIIVYSNDGLVIDSQNYGSRWKDVVPDSVGEDWIKAIREYALAWNALLMGHS